MATAEEYREILESILNDLGDALNEPHASDWGKVFIVQHLIDRYKFYLENPEKFKDAKRIVALSKGKME